MESRWFGFKMACPQEGIPPEPKSAHIWNGEVTTLQKQNHVIESLALAMTEDITATRLNEKRGQW